jgi:O-antigen/teichoic acid export membrane protein
MKKRLATYAASNLLSGVASLLSVLVLVRLLPPEQYGEYVTVLVVAALCQTAGFRRVAHGGGLRAARGLPAA